MITAIFTREIKYQGHMIRWQQSFLVKCLITATCLLCVLVISTLLEIEP